MSYDTELGVRLQECLAGEVGLSQKKMFGGLAFLVNGNMAIAASGQGGLLVRADPEREEQLLRSPGVSVAVMQGRPMSGWLRVEPAQVKTKTQLAKWAREGATYARSLPPKRAKSR